MKPSIKMVKHTPHDFSIKIGNLFLKRAIAEIKKEKENEKILNSLTEFDRKFRMV